MSGSGRKRQVLGALAVIPLIVIVAALTALPPSNPEIDRDAARAISKGLMDDSDPATGFVLAQAEADCIGQRLAEDFGTAKLATLGFVQAGPVGPDAAQENRTMPTEDAEHVAAVFDECLDLPHLLKGELYAALGSDISGPMRRCVEQVVDSALARRMLADVYDGDDKGQERFQKRIDSCTNGR